MSQATPPLKADELCQLPSEKLVEIILAQQSVINQLQQEVERLKVSLNLDSLQQAGVGHHPCPSLVPQPST